MDKEKSKILTKERLVGMQVINSEGYIIGKVKELSLIVGKPDQALLIEDDNANEHEIWWSDVMSAGDVILLKPKDTKEENICPSCGTLLDKETVFCPNCGNRKGG